MVAAAWPGGVRGLVAGDRLAQAAIAVTIVAAVWFATGPGAAQPLSVRALTPPLAAMTAAGMWRIGADRRLPASSARFWLVLALAMCLFAAGMTVDFVARALDVFLPEARSNAGETLLYPIAGLFAILGFVVYPTTLRTRMDRVKTALDIMIVLFAGATFVWYFVGSQRWHPEDGWQRLADRLVLPALTLVAGFAILRITLAGAKVISRPTMICFVFAAVSTAASTFLWVDGWTIAGRFGSTVQVTGLAACVVGVAIQRRIGPVPPEDRPAGGGWRRPFTVLPYAALAATMGLFLLVVGPRLDYRGWVVAVGVCALCMAVIGRQFTSLWENSRLLRANRELTTRLHRHAYYDHLTGLANRTLFTDSVVAALAGTTSGRLRRCDGGLVAVLLVDLDDFKVVNDSFGHHVGDELLVAVSERLLATTGRRDVLARDVPARGDVVGGGDVVGHDDLVGGDMLCRLGGDEFAVLLLDATRDAAAARAREIVAALNSPIRLSDSCVRVAASVGIALASRGELTAVELLRNADIAMYEAKNAGKGGWRVFEAAMLTGLMRRHELRAALPRALERDEVQVRYQPIVDLGSGRLEGAEAQARWCRPTAEQILPDEFVPLAQECGVIAEIELYVLAKACCQAAQWLAELGPGERFDLHVNLSAHHLDRPELVDDVEGALRTSGLPATSLTLEITESGLVQHHGPARERLHALNRLGVHLAIDHFGTGYSSLALLRFIPADTIKIDKVLTADVLDCAQRAAPAGLVGGDGFVAPDGRAGGQAGGVGLVRRDGRTAVAEAVIGVAATLGIRTVAEGIERDEQARRLLELGSHCGQGPLYGRSMAAETLGQLVARRALAYEVRPRRSDR